MGTATPTPLLVRGRSLGLVAVQDGLLLERVQPPVRLVAQVRHIHLFVPLSYCEHSVRWPAMIVIIIAAGHRE
jgi:hypothetical protein